MCDDQRVAGGWSWSAHRCHVRVAFTYEGGGHAQRGGEGRKEREGKRGRREARKRRREREREEGDREV